MMKIDGIVIKETKYIAIWVLALSVVLQGIFLVLRRWDYTVFLGNLLSGSACVLNFLLMGITVQKAVSKEPDAAKMAMKMSQLYRMLFLLIVVIIGVVLPCFHIWAVIIPLFFVRIAVSFRPLFDKKEK